MRNRGDEPLPQPQASQLEEKFQAFVDEVFASGTVLPKATKHLIAAAIASLERDAAVTAEHLEEARTLGTSEAEIAEALAVVSGQAGGTQLFWIKEDYEELLGPRWRSEFIPGADRSFWAFKRALFAEGALSARIKQLIAIAVSSKLRCRHCAVGYIKLALKDGATKAEVAETLGVLWAVSCQAKRST